MSIFLILAILTFRKMKVDYSNYKITNWTYTYTISALYLMFSFGLIFLIRLLRINYPIDLLYLWSLFKTFMINLWLLPGILTFFILINIVLTIFLSLILLAKVHKHHKLELLKLHLYHLEKGRLISPSTDSFYKKLSIRKFYQHLAIQQLSANLLFFLNRMIDKFFPTMPEYPLNRFITIFMDCLPIFILIICVIYDCMYNKFILNVTMYYLPLFLLLMLYIRYSYFICGMRPQYDAILFERYYRYPEIVYIEVTEEMEQDLLLYLKSSLQKNVVLYLLSDYMDMHPLQIYHRFERVPSNPYLYWNPNNQTAFLWHNLKKDKYTFYPIKLETIFLSEEQMEILTYLKTLRNGI